MVENRHRLPLLGIWIFVTLCLLLVLFTTSPAFARTRLLVQEHSGEFANLRGDLTITDTSVNLNFRWFTSDNITGAKWELYKKFDRGGTRVLKTETLSDIPQQGKLGIFNVSLTGQGLGIVFVRVIPINTRISPIFLDPSNSVEISVKSSHGGPGGGQMSTPRVVVSINKIVVNDDSDDLSAGDLVFCFWLQYAGKMALWENFAASVDTDGSVNPNMKVKSNEGDALPQEFEVHVRAYDDDTPEGLELVAKYFLKTPGVPVLLFQGLDEFGKGRCKAGSTADFDFAVGHSAKIQVPPGATQTTEQNFPSFTANGTEDLKFTVSGTWQIVP